MLKTCRHLFPDRLLLRPGLPQIIPDEAEPGTPFRKRFDPLDAAIDQWFEEHHMAA
jgi:hypothetical protein